LDSKILLGVIAVTIFGTLAAQSMMIEAGMSPIETIVVTGDTVFDAEVGGETISSEAECPSSHPFLIGGSPFFQVVPFAESDILPIFSINPSFDTENNIYKATPTALSEQVQVAAQARALCAKFNFPMNMDMIGGELLDINSVSLLVGAIGTNPVITGLVAVTIAGVAGQAVWFVHRRKKSENS